MFRPSHPATHAPREGVILIVVIVLLTLFAVIGLTFVLYSDAEATASRLFREAQNLDDDRPDESPLALLNFGLGQLVFDVDDTKLAQKNSAIRGHSLARNMYGWNTDFITDPVTFPFSNLYPFNGTGRLHTGPGSYLNPYNLDDHFLINYMYFANDTIRDPERLGTRANPAQSINPVQNPYTGGWNPSYTYPDLNHLYLAAVDADWNVLIPSFHRPWLFQTSGQPLNDMSNPKWTSAAGKYQILRPRPADHFGAFSSPADATGDVKNLVGAPGGNDSIWVDLGYQVKTGPDGKKYKPLFAFLIVDLDGRVNLNVAGNALGHKVLPGPSYIQTRHASNQGLGPWEINPGFLSGTQNNYAEWRNLLWGKTVAGTPVPGRYVQKPGELYPVPHPNPWPQPLWSPGLALQSPGMIPHVYAQLDLDAYNRSPVPAQQIATKPIKIQNPNPTVPFPDFQTGYGNGHDGSVDPNNDERGETLSIGHPARYDFQKPAGGDPSNFDISEMKSLLYNGYSGNDWQNSRLGQLLPGGQALGNKRIRNMVSTRSAHVVRPGLTPWIYDRDNSSYQVDTATPSLPPKGSIPVHFPALSERFNLNPPVNNELAKFDWRAVDAVLGSVDLNRFLTPYPHMGYNTDQVTFSPESYVSGKYPTFQARFDEDNGGPIWKQYKAAELARQQLANDIYRRLLKVTGVARPKTPGFPSDPDLMPRRWLAQLAANIVDFIDEDEISTPFQYYTAADDGLQDDPYAVGKNTDGTGNTELLKYWVFGTELPRVVLNEVLVEYNSTNPAFNVRVWAELFNPLPSNVPATAQSLDSQAIPLYVPPAGPLPGIAPYRIVIAPTNPNFGSPGYPLLPRPTVLPPSPGYNDNILGTPAQPKHVETTDGSVPNTDFAGTPGLVLNSSGAPVSMSIPPQGFFLVGPPNKNATQADERGAIDVNKGVKDNTPLVQCANMEYQATVGTLTPDTVLLRRLANPYLPKNDQTNPYVTVDYMERLQAHDGKDPTPVYKTRGKDQPYTSDLTKVQDQTKTQGTSTHNSFGWVNTPPGPAIYDWLVHLDRQLISPMELLHVSGFHPHELTHQFITPAGKFTHRVPWTDSSNRLYRIFAYLECHNRMAGVSPMGGPVPGKININTIWNKEILYALMDPQTSNHFTKNDIDGANGFWNKLQQWRTPGDAALLIPQGIPSKNDRPFLSFSIGNIPPGDPTDPLASINGTSIENTVLTSGMVGGTPITPRLFQKTNITPATDNHPYLQDEALNKIYNNITTRSNVFAVWITVGFFAVVDDSSTSNPVKLGPEIGLATGKNIRHRMFAIVDRSNLSIMVKDKSPLGDSNPRLGYLADVVPGTQDLQLTKLSGTTSPDVASGEIPIKWNIDFGTVLYVGTPDDDQETVIVVKSPITGNPSVTFLRPHAKDAPVRIPGNPGPQDLDVTKPVYAPVVPYATIIQ